MKQDEFEEFVKNLPKLNYIQLREVGKFCFQELGNKIEEFMYRFP